MRLRVLPPLACGLAALACTPAEAPSCPGTAVGTFTFTGTLVLKDGPAYPALEGLDPDSGLPDCTPDPSATNPPIRYPPAIGPFDAKLAAAADGSAAALCRPNGALYSGERTGSTYSLSAEADPALLCGGVCVAGFRVDIVGDVAIGTDGAPTGFDGLLVETLTASRGACDGCLPPVPLADPPELACEGRYHLTAVPR